MHPKRFFPAVVIGGGGAGFVLALPILGDILRCALCLGVIGGATLSLKLWLDSHRAENLSPTEAAYLGVLSGGASALVGWVVSVPIRVAFGDSLVDFYMNRTFLPDSAKYLMRALYTADFGDLLVTLFFQMIVYGGMGALGAFVALEVLFKARRTDVPAA